MGWSIGYEIKRRRYIGYGVPAYCDHPGCDEEIDRGLGFKCEREECGCEKFYCSAHRYTVDAHTYDPPPRRVHPDWREHQLADESWAKWRDENPDEVAELMSQRNEFSEDSDDE